MATPIADQLHHKLLGQDFTGTDTAWPQEQLKALAELYAETEQAIAVLSDMQANRSYICYGGIAATLGISCPVQHKTIDSIWEEEIFSGTHPDDLQNKYFLELQFFNTVKQLPRHNVTDFLPYIPCEYATAITNMSPYCTVFFIRVLPHRKNFGLRFASIPSPPTRPFRPVTGV